MESIMKKVLIASDLKDQYIKSGSFLNRADIVILSAATNDEMLKIHSAEKADLILTKVDMPGISSEELFESLRRRKDLRDVSIIIICEDTPTHRSRAVQCGANAVLIQPVDAARLHMKAQEFLNVAPRQSYRVTLKVSVEGKFKNKPFLYRTDNISATGMLILAEIKTGEMLVQGDLLSFSFYLPDGRQINAHGTVERIIPQTIVSNVFLYGIRFTDLTPDSKSALEIFIKKEQSYKRALTPAS
jgi:response regulator RpfG family c-di-GMP phosphodiesterase